MAPALLCFLSVPFLVASANAQRTCLNDACASQEAVAALSEEPLHGISFMQTNLNVVAVEEPGLSRSSDMVFRKKKKKKKAVEEPVSLAQDASASSTSVAAMMQTCSPQKFETAKEWLLEHKHFQDSLAMKRASAKYETIANRTCKVTPAWYSSDRPLIVNVGEGSTGTSWLTHVMKQLGYRSQHWFYEGRREVNGTFDVDQYDYVTDTPISSFTWELLQSHPNAVFLSTVREPDDWVASRVEHHIWPEMPFAQMALPCGMRNPRCPLSTGNTAACEASKDSEAVAQRDAAELYAVYSIWSTCVLPPDRLLTLNLMAGNDSDRLDELTGFLERHGLQKDNWSSLVPSVKKKLETISKRMGTSMP